MLGAGAFQYVTVSIPAAQTADVSWIPLPDRCRILELVACIEAAIDTNPLIITPSIGGVDITGGAVTIPTAGSAAGTTVSAKGTALREAAAGTSLLLTFNGGPATTGGAVTVTVKIGAQGPGT